MDAIAVMDEVKPGQDQARLPDPEHKQKLRAGRKERAFRRLLFSRPELTPTECALATFDCKDKKTAAAIACQLLKKLNISRQEILERAGLTEEKDAEDLARLRSAKKVVSAVFTGSEAGAADKDFIEVDDNQTQFRALELTYKIKGAFNDEKAGPSDHIQNFLTIIEQVNVENSAKPDKGIVIDIGQNQDLNKYLAK